MLDRSCPFLVPALAVVALALPLRAQAPQYTLTNVSDAVGGSAVGAAGLSDTGFVAGWTFSDAPPFGTLGFRWSAAGTLVPPPPPGVDWLTFNSVDVNDAGTFVGHFGALSSSSMTRGYRTQAGLTAELLTPLGLTAFPTAINDRGVIVGQATLQPGGTPGAVVWSPDLAASFVGRLDSAMDINNRGQIIGLVFDENFIADGYFHEGGVSIPLGSLAPDPAQAGDVVPMSINDAGTVVGYSVIGPAEHAFRWTAASGMTELPGLGFSVFPFNVAALDINESGVILGYAPAPDGQTSVLWSPDGTVTSLKELVPDIGLEKNWPSLLHAMRINAVGQIAAMAAHKPSGYQARTVLLTPAWLQATQGATSLEVSGAAPGRPVYLVVGAEDPLDTGYTMLPGCEPMGVCMDQPLLLGAALADGAGSVVFEWTLPAGLAGQAVRLQAVQLDPCAVSNVVHVAR